jgi:dipeptidyl aminopeptidase/acylaminoacyl peptidase
MFTPRRLKSRTLAVRSFIAVCLLLVASFAWAQTKRAMTLVDMFDVPRVADPQLSADGRQVLFTMDKPDWKADRRISHIWRINTDGTGLVQLTYGDRGESSPRRSPDGTTIAFLTRRGESEETQIFLLNDAGGEARSLSRHATGVSSISWSPDGETMYFLASDAKTDEEKERDRVKDDVFAFDENYKQQHVWKISVKDAAEQKLTSGDYSVSGYKLSRDGRKIVIDRAPTSLLGDAYLSEIWVMDKDGRNGVQLTRNTIGEGSAELSPDNSQALFVASSNLEVQRDDGNVFVVPAAGGAARPVLTGFPYDVESATWSKDGRSIYMHVNMGVHSELFQVDVAGGKPRQLTDGQHATTGWSLAPALDRHVFQFDEPTRPGEIWTLSGAGAAPARVTNVYEYLDREFKLPRQEKIQWKGADGVTVEGLLYYPLDYEQGKRYPLCVQTHGGPYSSDKFGFGGPSSYVPVLAAKGYAVLKPNYRGSTGYGSAFVRDLEMHYFKNAHLDVMAGVDSVITMGVADGDRMVKMGWSAGGHMTDKIITFTDRFKAAASGAGASNWISMVAQSDIHAHRFAWFGATPWGKNAPIDLYWEQSPLKYAANVKTPTIFLVGQNDPRVPMPQSVEMYRALKSNGVPTHLYVGPREPHGWGELRHQLFKANVELDWFEKYAMGRSYVWEKAPPDREKERSKTSSQ